MCKDKLVLHLGVTLNNSSKITTWSRTDKMENMTPIFMTPMMKSICIWCHKCKRNPWFAQQDVSLMNFWTSVWICGSWICMTLHFSDTSSCCRESFLFTLLPQVNYILRTITGARRSCLLPYKDTIAAPVGRCYWAWNHTVFFRARQDSSTLSSTVVSIK